MSSLRIARGLAAGLVLAGCGASGSSDPDASTPSPADAMSSLEAGISDDDGPAPPDGSSQTDASDAGAVVATADAGTLRLVAYTGGYASTIFWFTVDGSTGALSPSGSI